ncbi:hypothetical protein [Pseudomonas jilinensis]|uniref:Phage holin family protein n=1 Tax=Pseudomonas jilinensis TaxID=2078689 RepID=A0A396S090_9PSED|nr:hypothetical protein [Pseudomonas jilinensis]RHW22159.1 hypothetical protein C2846_03790 [Pseudomonas jilinensis]
MSAQDPVQEPAGNAAGLADANELQAWLDWARQALAAGDTLGRLFQAELRLALADARRLLLIALALLPLLLMSWLGLSVLFGWLVYHYSASMPWAITGFIALQLLCILALLGVAQSYRRHLRLPATRRHVQAFLEGARHVPQATDH